LDLTDFNYIALYCYSSTDEVLYKIPIEYVITIKLFRLIKMCLYETYSKFRTSKNLNFPFRIVGNRELLYRHGFSTFL